MPSYRHPVPAGPRRWAFALAAAALASSPAAGASEGSRPPEPPAAERPATPPATSPAPAGPVPVDTIVVRASDPRPSPRRPAVHIDLSLRDADLVEVLRSFARLGGFDLVVDPRVKGTVTVELHDVPWDRALAVILRTHGLAAEVDDRIVAVGPLPGLGPR